MVKFFLLLYILYISLLHRASKSARRRNNVKQTFTKKKKHCALFRHTHTQYIHY